MIILIIFYINFMSSLFTIYPSNLFPIMLLFTYDSFDNRFHFQFTFITILNLIHILADFIVFLIFMHILISVVPSSTSPFEYYTKVYFHLYSVLHVYLYIHYSISTLYIITVFHASSDPHP